MTLSRRKFITGTALLFATPAIVRASSLMPVQVITPLEPNFVRLTVQGLSGDDIVTLFHRDEIGKLTKIPQYLDHDPSSTIAGWPIVSERNFMVEVRHAPATLVEPFKTTI